MEVFRALAALCEPPGPQTGTLAAALGLDGPVPDEAGHTELFLFQLYPYASVYLGPEGQLGGPARDRVAGFWRAVGLTPPAEPDHLAALLGLLAALADAERAYVLKALLAQDPSGTLAWLAGEARRQLERHVRPDPAGTSLAFWSRRAGATAALLDDVRADSAAKERTVHH